MARPSFAEMIAKRTDDMLATVAGIFASGKNADGTDFDLTPALTALLDGTAINTATATIASGASLSGAVDVAGKGVLRIIMPAAWTTAALTFQTSIDATTYTSLYDSDGGEYTVQAAANRSIILDISVFTAMRYLKIQSGTSAATVNQAAARTLTLVTKPL